METDFGLWLDTILNRGDEEEDCSFSPLILGEPYSDFEIPDIPDSPKKRKMDEQEEEKQTKKFRGQPHSKFKELMDFQYKLMKQIKLDCGSVEYISGLKLIMNDPKNGTLQCHIHQNYDDGALYLISAEQSKTKSQKRTYKIKCLTQLHDLFNEYVYKNSPLMDSIRQGNVNDFFSFVKITTL